MNDKWPTVILGEVLRYISRPVSVRPDQTYREIGIRSHGKGVFHKEPVTGFELGSKRVFNVEPGDFVLNIVFAWEGAVAVLSGAESGMIGSHRFPTFRSHEARLDPYFLLAYFKTPEGLETLGRVSPGGAGRNRTLSRTAFLRQRIPLPPLTEQRRIVTRIGALTEQIEDARRSRHQASNDTKALWAQAAREVFDRAAARYPRRLLGDLVTVRGGGTPSKSDPSYWNGSIPWITPKDMKRRALIDAIEHVSERATKESSAKLIDPGAVLVVVRGMILAHTFPSAVLRVPATINQDMKALVPKKDISPAFLSSFLWATNSCLIEMVAKSTHDTRKFETEKLLGIRVVVPPLAEQRRILGQLDMLQAQVDDLGRLQTEMSAEIDALAPSVLAMAFRGELVSRDPHDGAVKVMQEQLRKETRKGEQHRT